MTNEEAKANLEKLLLLYDDGMIDFHVIRESVKVAIEALQDSPTQMSGTSEDTISRQAAIDAVEESRRLNHHKDGKEACAHEYEHRHFLRILSELPSVMPERKPGKWEIYVISVFDGEGCRCSECGFEGAPYWDFCPGCGVRMEDIDDKRKSD